MAPANARVGDVAEGGSTGGGGSHDHHVQHILGSPPLLPLPPHLRDLPGTAPLSRSPPVPGRKKHGYMEGTPGGIDVYKSPSPFSTVLHPAGAGLGSRGGHLDEDNLLLLAAATAIGVAAATGVPPH